jgi:hypothetical protein
VGCRMVSMPDIQAGDETRRLTSLAADLAPAYPLR